MGPSTRKFSCPVFLLLLLATHNTLAQTAGERTAQATDLRRRLIEQQQRATVCEVRSRHLDQQVTDLKEQLAATRDALTELVAQHTLPDPSTTDALMTTAEAHGNSIEVEELPEPDPPTVAATTSRAGTAAAKPHGGEDTGGQDTGGQIPSQPLATPSVEALALYDEGYTLFHEQRYPEAVTHFENYVERYPNTELTDNALFWIGECHYALKNFEAALEAFTTTISRYPDGNKVADALLKAGKSLMALGEHEEADRTFEEVTSRFPNAAAAATAAELLAN
jgi:tol-pal system protein YbgF